MFSLELGMTSYPPLSVLSECADSDDSSSVSTTVTFQKLLTEQHKRHYHFNQTFCANKVTLSGTSSCIDIYNQALQVTAVSGVQFIRVKSLHETLENWNFRYKAPKTPVSFSQANAYALCIYLSLKLKLHHMLMLLSFRCTRCSCRMSPAGHKPKPVSCCFCFLTSVCRMSSEISQLCLEALSPLAEQCAKNQEKDTPLFIATRHFLKVRPTTESFNINIMQ